MADENIASRRLRPAHEIYARLKWDTRFDVTTIVIGYEDRFKGVLEMAFATFEDPLTEVPFHRVRYFRFAATGELLWDRRARIDVITNGYDLHAPAEANTPVSNYMNGTHLSQARKREALKLRRLERRLRQQRVFIEEDRRNEEIEKRQADELPRLHERILRAQARTPVRSPLPEYE